MSRPLHILIVEDSETDAFLLLRELRRGDFDPSFERVDTPAAMAAALERQAWDIVVSDFSMPGFNALAALELLNQKELDVPFIIVSGTIGEELAVSAMKNGARDYIMKDNLTRLPPAIDREMREAAARRERKRVQDELSKTREQFRVAREIQQRLFPKSTPPSVPFDVAGASHPAEATGGDYFDYLALAGDAFGIVVADVTGHGVGPALLMAETRAYLRTLALNAADVGDILTRANRVLSGDVDIERFVTMLLAGIDPVSRTLVYASAGHPDGYLLDSAGRVKSILKRTGVPLGVRPGSTYPRAGAIELSEGDILLLLTDGIEETLSPGNQFFGADRILDTVRAHSRADARTILDRLFEAVREFSRDQPPVDDLTAVVVKFLPPG